MDRTRFKTAGDGRVPRVAHLAARLEGGGTGAAMLTYGEGKTGGEVGSPEARESLFGETLCFRRAPWLWVLARRATLRGTAALAQPRDVLWPQGCFQPLPSAVISWARVSLSRDAAQATPVRWHCSAYLTSKVRNTACHPKSPTRGVQQLKVHDA